MEPISETVECNTDVTPEGRRVIKRVYKVRYRPDGQESTQSTQSTTTTSGSGSGSQRSKSGSQRGSQRSRHLQRGKSMKAYDQETDSDIFTLGSAFKDGDFKIDDFLKSWTTTLPGFKTVTRTTQSEEGDISDLPSGFMGAVTPPIGNFSTAGSVFPFVRRERLMTSVTPETGETKSIVTATVSNNDDSSEETYDNLSGQLQPLLPQDGRQGIHGNTTQASGYGDAPQQTGNYGDITPASSYGNVTPVGRHGNVTPVGSYGNTTQAGSYGNKSQPNLYPEYEPEKKPLLIQDSAPSTPREDDKKPAKRAEFTIDIGDSDTMSSSADEVEIYKPKPSPTCPPFYSPKGRRGKNQRKGKTKMFDQCSKGKVGMTASEIPLLGEEKQLPAVQQIVMNYNRMLDTHPEHFVETLFRAVKLNGVDVVKILCQLVLRKNMKLSSDELREPESSATVLHVALLYDHAEMVEYLIDVRDSDLIMATYTKDEYKNQTALHVAVANGNQNLVNRLLLALDRKERKLLMNTVASGSYFRENHPDGQLCLTVAAWAGNVEMLITLARHGANMTLKNIDGNTLMHRIIESSALHPDKMDYQIMVDKAFDAVGEWAKQCKYKSHIADQRVLQQAQKQISTFQRLLATRNNCGLTPLALAAQVGSPLLQYILNMERIHKIPQTKLGSISWVTYEVTEVASFTKDTYNKFSILHILAHNSGRSAHHDNSDQESDDSGPLDQEPIKTLIAMKWSVYRWVYIVWCLLHLFVHIAFTQQTFDKNSYRFTKQDIEEMFGESDFEETEPEAVKTWLGVFIILPVVYILLELVDLLGIYPYSLFFMENMTLLQKVFKRVQSEWVITGNGPYRCVMVAYSVFTIVWFLLYLKCSIHQNTALAMSLLLGWIFVLFFTRGCRVTSRFSIMIQKMFFRDLMYFLAVYVIILLGFSFAMNAMYTHLHQASIHLPRVIYRMMNIVTELDQRQAKDEILPDTRHPLFTKMLLIMYAIVAVILLMNMLIAMMNTSYESIRITRSNLWKQQQLSIMLMLERRLFWVKCLCHKSESSIWQKNVEEDVKSYIDVTITYF